MKQLVASRTIDIPAGVEIEVKARKVRVKGPRGESKSYEGLLHGPWQAVQHVMVASRDGAREISFAAWKY